MKILIVPNPSSLEAVECSTQVDEKLRALGCETVILTDGVSSGHRFTTGELSLVSDCDMIVAVGGDGTTLRTAKAAALLDKPVLGINAGRLGYLAVMERSELDQLSSIVERRFIVEKRMMLDVSLYSVNGQRINMYALNDAVIARGSQSKIIDVSIQVNGSAQSEFHADGVIFSTPTGSTAYAFSAGGPVIDPTIDCIELTPVCSHSIFARPVIYSAETVLRVSGKSRDKGVYLTVDGEEELPLDGGYVEIRRSQLCAKLIHLHEHSFYDVLMTKFKS